MAYREEKKKRNFRFLNCLDIASGEEYMWVLLWCSFASASKIAGAIEYLCLCNKSRMFFVFRLGIMILTHAHTPQIPKKNSIQVLK